MKRDGGDAELVEDVGEHQRRGAVVVVDDDPQLGGADGVDVDPGEDVVDIGGPRRGVLDVAHLVEADPADVLADEQVLDLALGALVDGKPVGIEEAHVGAALIER